MPFVSPLVALAALVVLVISSGCAQAQSLRQPSDREVRLYARLLAMTDSRTLDRAVVDSALASRWSPLRAAAALAVGQIGATHGSVAAPTLRALTTDSDLTVASNAAYSLGLLVDSAGVGTLASALTGPPRVAREAAWALGEIGGPARSIIVTALASPGADEARMIQLLLAAAKLRPVPVEEMRPYLRMFDRPSVVWAAAYAIARTRTAAGVRDLIDLASRPLPSRGARPRAQVSKAGPGTAEVYVAPALGMQRALSEIGRGLAKTAAGDSLGDQAFAVLSKLATDRHPHVRINAVRSLATYGARARDAVMRAAADPDANVRIATAQVAGTVLDSSAVSWNELWRRDSTVVYRASILSSAARVGALREPLAAWMTHTEWQYRAAAVSALGAFSDRRYAAAATTRMLRDSDGRVRSAAYGLLTGTDTTPPAPDIQSALIAGLSDRDFMVRATILGTLARHARAADVPAVIATYKLSSADSSNDAQIAAIRYVAAAWKRDSAAFSPVHRASATGLAASPDPLVRAEARNASIFGAWPSTSGTARPLPWYENLVRTYVVPSLNGRMPRATIRTSRGDVVLEMFGSDAPLTVWNFLNLARTGYYRSTSFHRVVPNFVAQDGDPRGDGNGGPGYSIRDEMNPRRYERGALGMALSGPDTGGSQYFITHSPQPHLDGHYTVFGRVLRGLEVLDRIVQGDSIRQVIVQ